MVGLAKGPRGILRFVFPITSRQLVSSGLVWVGLGGTVVKCHRCGGYILKKKMECWGKSRLGGDFGHRIPITSRQLFSHRTGGIPQVKMVRIAKIVFEKY